MDNLKNIRDKNETEGELDDAVVEAVAGGTIVPATAWCPFCKKEHELSMETQGRLDRDTDTFICDVGGQFYHNNANGHYYDGNLDYINLQPKRRRR